MIAALITNYTLALLPITVLRNTQVFVQLLLVMEWHLALTCLIKESTCMDGCKTNVLATTLYIVQLFAITQRQT